MKGLHGLYRTLIANSIQGVTEGFFKILELQGVGFKVVMKGNDLELSVGYSHYESEQHNTTNVTEEATSYQIAYTMGGASIRLAEASVDNSKYQTGATYDRDATTLSVSLAF